ncbi:MAG: hypothetical protein J6B51_08530 [Clostridia bacterium]|nr:hypothetical protein [Clostridia bacterium]
MSKKIISAILVMAMVISMSATALLSSVGAAAETEVDYEADRTTLKTMLQEFVIEGPKLNADTIEYLKTLGILTWNNDKGYYNEEHAREEFWKNFGGDSNYTYFFKGADADFAKNFVTEGAKKNIFANTNETWATTTSTDVSYLDLAVDNISTVIEYAASAWYFGKEANDANADATFNAERNNVVKKAIGMVNTVLDLLKNEVKADSDKPADYAKEFNGQFYRGFATTSKAYNQAIGFNPYFFILEQQVTEDGNYYGKDYYEDTYYGTILGQYTIRWYTFAEAREIDAEGVFAFENMIRTMAIDNGAGVLFYDFVNGNRKDFLDIVKSLFENLVGKVETSFIKEDVDTQIKAFLKLKLIVEKVYDLYIKDVYNNIYTASSAKLLNDVLYAKRLIEYITAESTNSRLIALALADFTTLTNDILAGIEAVAPRAEQLLKAADITEGTALVRKAEALLANCANWASNDDYKGTWNALNDAKNALKNMLPATEGADASIVIEANTAKMKNIAGTEIGNDRIFVEFAPNWFAYIKLYALLEEQIANFTKKVTGVDGSLSAPNLTGVSNSDLVNAINKYAHLIGIVGPIVEISDYTKDGKDNKTVNLVDTTVWTKYDADPDKGVYKEDTNKPTANYKATVKYISYLFDCDPMTSDKYDREGAVLYYFAFSDGGKGYPHGNDIYSADKYCYVNYKYENSYIEVIRDLLAHSYISNTDNKVDSMYEIVLGSVEGNNAFYTPINQDVAIDSVYVLMQAIDEAAEYAVDNTKIGADTWTDGKQYYYEFNSEGKFDWVNDKYVFTAGHDKAVNSIIEAVKNLTKDITKLTQTYYAILFEVAKLFDWSTIDAANGNTLVKLAANAQSQYCWGYEDNYADGAMDAALEAANELYSYVVDCTTDWNEDDKVVENSHKFATYSKLIAAYDEFENAIKTNLFTAAGSEKFDAYVEDVYYMIDTYLGTSDYWNEYDKLFEKFITATNGNFKHFVDVVDDMRNCYEYFALTLAHASECGLYFGNRYSNVNDVDDDPATADKNEDVVTPFEKNLLNPLNGHIGTIDVTGYTRDWAEMYNAVRQIAAGIVEASKNLENCDMPVWYAERVLKECNDVKAASADYTTAKLVEYKAGLEALLIEADGLNVYNYLSNTDEAKAIWAAFVEAYANAQYTALDTRCAKSDVDEAVAALEAAMADLAKIEAPEGAADADTLAAKIAAAEALYARADVTDADQDELEVAIAAAKKVLQFNISVLNSTDIEAEIKVLDDLMNALLDTMYTGKDLKKAVKVLELQVVVDLYTEASYRKFANAVEAAYAMAEEDTASESAMKAAYANVEARFGDLKLAPVEEEPEVVEPETSVVMEEAIAIYNDAANGYDKAVEGCTAESAAAYNAAINTLKADIENNADDAKLLESIIALNLAKAALTVDVPETCDC